MSAPPAPDRPRRGAFARFLDALEWLGNLLPHPVTLFTLATALLFAAQMVEIFKYTQLGPIVAVRGADLLKAIDLTGPLVFAPFILLCCFVNLMLGSASALRQAARNGDADRDDDSLLDPLPARLDGAFLPVGLRAGAAGGTGGADAVSDVSAALRGTL